MNRTAILSVTSLIIFCLSVGQVLSSFALYIPPTAIATSGTIIENTVEPTRIGKLLVAYGTSSPVSQDFIVHMAKFDLIDTDFKIGPDVEKIKAINPSIIILQYNDVMARSPDSEDWTEVDQHEDWFLHDVSGSRLQNEYWGSYCMDISSQGWRQHYADYVKEKIDLYGFDGVFADDVWTHLFKDAWTVPSEDVPDWNYMVNDYTYWQTQMREFLSYVKSRIGDRLLIYNGPSNIYLDVSDGKMMEDFAFYDKDWRTPIEDINNLAEISATGKYYLASPYAHPAVEDTEEKFLYALCCFLLGVNGPNAYFSWINVWSEPSHGYYSEFDKAEDLGSSIGDYYSYQNVLARDFENGKVLVNPSDYTYNVDLQGTYETLDGEVVTEITMEEQSAAILKKG